MVAPEMGDAPAAAELAWSAARRGDDAEAERWLDWAGQLRHAGLSLDRLGIATAGGDEASARHRLVPAAEERHSGAQVGLGLPLLKEGDESSGWGCCVSRRRGGGGRPTAVGGTRWLQR